MKWFSSQKHESSLGIETETMARSRKRQPIWGSQKHESSLGIETFIRHHPECEEVVPKSMNPLWGLKPVASQYCHNMDSVPKSMNPLWGLKPYAS